MYKHGSIKIKYEKKEETLAEKMERFLDERHA